MGKRIKQENELFPVDNSANELFGELEKDNGKRQLKLSFIPSFSARVSPNPSISKPARKTGRLIFL